MDIKKIREDFRILDTGIIYFDNAATSLTPEPVIDKMLEFYHEYRANVERGVYQLSQRASEEYEKARIKISSLINARAEEEIIMTKNTSEGINTIASGLRWRKGEKIVTTNIEHHSNFIVWLRIKDKYGVNVEVIHANQEKVFDVADFEKTIDDKTKLVTVTHASNVLGSITPVKEIAEIAHAHGALMLIDGAQSVPHMKVNVQKIDCDFLAFSGHKMCGPTGIGALYIKEELLNEIEPLCVGGGTIEDVGINYYNLTKGPKKFEAGTPPIAEAIGLGAAVDYLHKIGMDKIQKHDMEMMEKMYNEMRKIPNVSVYGPEPIHRVSILPFNIRDLSPNDVALALDITAKIMVRSGAHCALPLMKDVIQEPKGTIRASTYLYNTSEEVDKFLEAIYKLSTSIN